MRQQTPANAGLRSPSLDSGTRKLVGADTGYHSGDFIGGKYRLEGVIGEGGMGSVWLARNTALDAPVALKLVRCDRRVKVAADRLVREAQVAARLEHPSIVRVFDFGETELGDPYIVMELVNGEQLADLLERKGRLAATHCVQLLLPICGALAAAHAQGIVHRDVKADNILLVPTETGLLLPKLVDFGIATQGERQRPGEKRITRMGEAIGTPHYMSPEQLTDASSVDGRCDVWATCVVLYECVSGPMPFEGESFAQLAAAVLTTHPKPITHYGAGDDELWAILERGLAKRLEDRWPSMRSFGAALARWAIDRGVDTDVAGGSLRAQWHQEGEARQRDTETSPSLRAVSHSHTWTRGLVGGAVVTTALVAIVAAASIAQSSGDSTHEASDAVDTPTAPSVEIAIPEDVAVSDDHAPLSVSSAAGVASELVDPPTAQTTRATSTVSSGERPELPPIRTPPKPLPPGAGATPPPRPQLKPPTF